MSGLEKITSENSLLESNQSDSGEDLSDISASESELIGDDTKSLNFGKTLKDEAELDWLVKNRMLEKADARLPSEDEMIPKPKPHDCVVFRDQFTAGLRMPCQYFIEEILKAYNIEIHHLTPNGIAKVALFIWTVKFQRGSLVLVLFALFMKCIHNSGTRMLMAEVL
jgi:hypothetical protein